VSQELQSCLAQLFAHFPLDPPSDADAIESPVGGFDTIQAPAFAFFQEFFMPLGFGSGELGNRRE